MSDAKAVADRLVKAKRLNALLTPPKDLRKSLVTQEAAARPTGVLYGMPVAAHAFSKGIALRMKPPPSES